MATRALVPVDEYLRTHYGDPDREYVDGRIVERSLPDYLHGETQALLCALFWSLNRRGLPFYASAETRLRTAATRFRIPDVSVFAPHRPTEPMPSEAPYIAIEVRSMDERETELQAKLDEYAARKIAHIWVIEPRSRTLFVHNGVLTETSSLVLPEYGVTIAPADIWP